MFSTKTACRDVWTGGGSNSYGPQTSAVARMAPARLCYLQNITSRVHPSLHADGPQNLTLLAGYLKPPVATTVLAYTDENLSPTNLFRYDKHNSETVYDIVPALDHVLLPIHTTLFVRL
jgi:hypothetical protein